jgi:hypothetical protein
MWRIYSLASLVVAIGVMTWPWTGLRQTGAAMPPPQQCDCCVVEVIHYGGNLICHQRLRKDVIGSGNNMLGQERVEAMNKKCCAEQQ